MASGSAAIPPFHIGDTLVVMGTATTDRGLLIFLDVHREPQGFVCYVAVHADDILLSFGRAAPASPDAGPERGNGEAFRLFVTSRGTPPPAWSCCRPMLSRDSPKGRWPTRHARHTAGCAFETYLWVGESIFEVAAEHISQEPGAERHRCIQLQGSMASVQLAGAERHRCTQPDGRPACCCFLPDCNVCNSSRSSSSCRKRSVTAAQSSSAHVLAQLCGCSVQLVQKARSRSKKKMLVEPKVRGRKRHHSDSAHSASSGDTELAGAAALWEGGAAEASLQPNPARHRLGNIRGKFLHAIGLTLGRLMVWSFVHGIPHAAMTGLMTQLTLAGVQLGEKYQDHNALVMFTGVVFCVLQRLIRCRLSDAIPNLPFPSAFRLIWDGITLRNGATRVGLADKVHCCTGAASQV